MKLLGFFVIGILSSSFSLADCNIEDSIPNQFIVRLKKSSETLSLQSRSDMGSSFKDFLARNSLPHETVFENPQMTLLSLTSLQTLPAPTYAVQADTEKELELIKQNPLVDSVERNCLFQIQGELVPTMIPNDPQMNEMWGLKKIQAEEAWDISRGSTSIITAISDTGVDYNHPDLKANMWVNAGEIPGNKIDDDNNGCIDDVYGCNFADGNGDPMPNGSNLSHGTHVAGTSGAVGNNSVGLSGVVQVAKIMALKGFTASGTGDTNALLKGIYYAANNGARVINCSWGRQGTASTAEVEAFTYAYNKGVVPVVAAGNDNIDAAKFTPANIAKVITVAATDSVDQIATFSNWGTIIDVAAPGGRGYSASGSPVDGIFSTLPNNQYGKYIGTSMAAPHVAGLAALILSINPNLTVAQVEQFLKDGADVIKVTTSGSGLKFDYKRINAFGSAKLAAATLPAPKPGLCKPGQVNCASSGSASADAFINFAQGSGCGSINSNGSGGNSGGAGMASLCLLLPFAIALKQRFKNR